MTRSRPSWIRDVGATGLLLLATFGFFWRILFTPDAWKPAGGGDLASFLYPTYRSAAAALHAGELPLWNPHLYGGAPFLADMQTGLFYPPNLLLFWLAPEFSYETLQWMAVFHVFLAGLFMYLCLRTLKPGQPLRVPAALAGALAYMFSGMFIVHFGNLNLIAVAAWLPLVFLLFRRSLHPCESTGRSPARSEPDTRQPRRGQRRERARRLGLATAAGVALALATLAGHLQITLYIGLALGITALFEAWAAARSRQAWARPLLNLAVTAAVAIGLAALVLLPALEYARLSPRAALPYRDAARFSLVPALLGELLVPGLFHSQDPNLYWGVWDRVAPGYVGILPLILAGLAVLMRRNGPVRIFVVLGGLAFLLSLGGQSIVHGWAYLLLPGFGQIRAPARWVLVLDFALAALAAWGLDRLLSPLPRGDRRGFEGAWRGLLWLGGAAVVVGPAWAYLLVFQAADRDPILLWRVSATASGVLFALLLLAASLAWLWARRTGRAQRRALAWLAVALIFLDLATLGAYTDLGDRPPTTGFDHPQVVSYLQGQPGLFRIDSRTDVGDVWQPDLALLAGLYDVGGVDNPLVVADLARFWEGTGGRSSSLYDLLGARYLVGSKEVALDWTKFSLAFDGDPALNLYRNETALPRAFLVHRAVVAAGHEDAWERIHQPGFDPATTVVLEGGERLGLPGASGDSGPAGGVRVVRYGTNSLEIEVDNPAEGYLLLSDPFYPGWRATVDGEVVPIVRADYAFRAVRVPTGVHRVVMTFRPATWRAGLAISGATLLLLLVAAGVMLLRRRETVGGCDDA